VTGRDVPLGQGSGRGADTKKADSECCRPYSWLYQFVRTRRPGLSARIARIGWANSWGALPVTAPMTLGISQIG
jgi:hypothetical protein